MRPMRPKCLVMLMVAAFAAQSHIASAQQKVVFCVEGIKYTYSQPNGPGFLNVNEAVAKSECTQACEPLTKENCPQGQLEKGWKISSSYPKEQPANVKWAAESCLCVGTQYILEASKTAQSRAAVSDTRDIELLSKEIALLKRENDLLKKENGAIQQKCLIRMPNFWK